MKNIFVGLSILADVIDFRKPEIVPLVLTGHFDDVLLPAFYYTAHGKVSEGEAYKTDERANYALRNLKEIIRSQISAFFRQLDEEERNARQMDMQRIRNELRQSNKPHAAGTVAEMATRYGVSKSEIRRMKAAGTLDDFIAQKEAP